MTAVQRREPISTGSDWSFELIERYDREIGRLAAEFGLDTYPNQIEIIRSDQMLDAYASIGVPLGYSHWSFGKHFVEAERAYQKGYMALAYEIVIQLEPLHRVPHGREHHDDAGAGGRARLLRPQLRQSQ